MTMKPPSLMNVLTRGCVLAAAMSVGTSAQSQSQPELKAGTNALEVVTSDERVFRTFDSGSQELNEMRARFDDPQQRAKMREAQRQGVAESHYGVADALQLDAATFDKLIDVLADQQMERSELFYKEFASPTSTPNPSKGTQAEAERVTQQINALREVLGQEKLEHYQKLQLSLGQRGQVRQFDQRLGDSHKLNSTQREQLVELLHEHLASSMERRLVANNRHSMLRDVFSLSREELQRHSELQTIAADEEMWREMPESNRQLREQAAAFLTKPQLAMLEQIHAEQLASLQQRIEQMRVQAGLIATIPEQPQVVELAPAPVNRDVKLSIKVSVDNESPRYLTTVVSGGKSVSLKISDDLSLEATPTVFENDTYNLRVEYFETRASGKRSIGNMGQSGTAMQAGQGEGLRYVAGGSSVLTGSKGYAVELSASMEST
jgi:hypothetical protein